MSGVIIEVRGGNVVGVYWRYQESRVTIVDWDDWEAGDTPASAHTVYSLPVSELPEETASVIASRKAYPVE